MTAAVHDDRLFMNQASSQASAIAVAWRASMYLSVNVGFLEGICRKVYYVDALERKSADPQELAETADKILTVAEKVRKNHPHYVLQHKRLVRSAMWLLRAEAVLKGEDPKQIAAPSSFLMALWDAFPRIFQFGR